MKQPIPKQDTSSIDLESLASELVMDEQDTGDFGSLFGELEELGLVDDSAKEAISLKRPVPAIADISPDLDVVGRIQRFEPQPVVEKPAVIPPKIARPGAQPSLADLVPATDPVSNLAYAGKQPEQDPSFTFYDIETFAPKKVSRTDIQWMIENGKVEDFAQKHISEEGLNQYMKDNHLDPEMSKTMHAIRQFGKGAGTMTGSALAQAGKLNEKISEWADKNPVLEGALYMTPMGLSTIYSAHIDNALGLTGNTGKHIKKASEGIRANPKYQKDFWLSDVPQGAGSMVPMVAAGLMTGGTGAGAMAAGTVGALGMGGTMYDDAIRHGATEETATLVSLIGMGIGTTEAIPLAGPLARIFGRSAATGAAKKGFGKLMKEIATDATKEGAQEAFSGVLQNLTAKELYDSTREIVSMETAREGAVGFVLGGFLSGASIAIDKAMNSGNLKPEQMVAMAQMKAAVQKVVQDEEAAQDAIKQSPTEGQSPLPDTDTIVPLEDFPEGDTEVAAPVVEPAPKAPEVKTEEPAKKAPPKKPAPKKRTPKPKPKPVEKKTETPETVAEPVAEPVTEPVAETTTEPVAEATPEPVVTPAPEAEAITPETTEQAPATEPVAETVAEPTTETEPVAENEFETAAKAEPEQYSKTRYKLRREKDASGVTVRAVRDMANGTRRYYKRKENGDIVEMQETPKGFVEKGVVPDALMRAFTAGDAVSQKAAPSETARTELETDGFSIDADGKIVVPEASLADKDAMDFAAKRLDGIIDRMVGNDNFSEKTDGPLLAELEATRDRLRGEAPVPAPEAPAPKPKAEKKVKEKPAAASEPEMPERTRKAISDAKTAGLSEPEIDALLEGVKNQERSDEGDAVLKSTAGKRLLQKNNGLITDYRKIPGRKTTARAMEKEARGNTAKAIHADIRNTKREGGSIAKQLRGYGKGIGKELSAFRDRINHAFEQEGPALTVERARQMVPEIARSFPAIKEALDKLSADIAALPSVTEAAAKQFGFASKEAFVNAMATRLLFDQKARDKGEFTGLHKDNQLDGFMDESAREVERKAKVWNELQSYASTTRLDQIEEGRETAVIKATQAYMDAAFEYVKTLFPNIRIHYADQGGFDAQAARVGRDPAVTKGFYHDGEIYINPALATQDTLFHEVGHVWLFMIRNKNLALYNMLARQVKNSPLRQQILDEFEAAGRDVMNARVQDEASMEAIVQSIGEFTANEFKNIQSKSAFRKALDKMSAMIAKMFNIPRNILAGNGFSTKKPLRLETMMAKDFLVMASREILSKSEIAIISDMRLAEFARANLIEHNIIDDGWATLYDKIARKEAGVFAYPQARIPTYMRKLFSDHTIQMYNVQKAIEQSKGPLHERLDIHGEMQLIPGRAKARIDAAMTKLYGNPDLRSAAARKASREASVLGQAEKEGVNWHDLATYLYALHASERNAKVMERIMEQAEKIKNQAKKDIFIIARMTEEGSGMSDAEAAVLKKQFESGPNGAAYQKYAKEVRDMFTEGIQDMYLKSGILTQKQVDEMKADFKLWVPLKVMEYTSLTKPFGLVSSSPLSMKGAGLKRIIGTQRFSYHHRMDPISGFINDYKRAAIESERNIMLQHFAELVKANPHKMWKVRSTRNVATYDKETGDVKSAFEIGVPTKNGVAFKEDGKVKYVEIEDKELLAAFTRPSISHSIRFLFNFLIRFQNFRRNMLTNYNPEFVPSNFSRDFLTAMTLIDAYVPQPDAKKNLALHVKGSAQAIRNMELGISNDPDLLELIAEGGEITWLSYEGTEEKLDQMDKAIAAQKKRSRNVKGYKVTEYTGKAAEAVGNTVLLANKVAEQTMRLAAYKTAKQAGMTPRQAALISKNITVNFNKRGMMTPYLNSLFLFSNAGIQGSLNMLDNGHKPGVMKNMIGIAGTAFLVAAYNDWLGDEDELDKILPGERRNQMHVVIPGTEQGVYKLPLGYGMNIPKIYGEQAYRVAAGKAGIVDAFKEIAISTEATFNPIGGGEGIAYNFVPDISIPAFELSQNRKFGGVPIRPEDPYGVTQKASTMFFKSVSTPSRKFAEGLSTLTGGEGDLPGWAEVSPEDIDYSIDYIFGGVGRFALNTYSFAESAGKGEFNINKMPIARRFFEDIGEVDYRNTAIFYDQYKNSLLKTYTPAEKRAMKSAYDEMRANVISDKRKRKSLESKYEEYLANQKKREAKSK